MLDELGIAGSDFDSGVDFELARTALVNSNEVVWRPWSRRLLVHRLRDSKLTARQMRTSRGHVSHLRLQ